VCKGTTDGDGFFLYDKAKSNVVAFRTPATFSSSVMVVSIKDMEGSLAVAPTYDDETAADAALDPRVLYDNTATGKFQVSST